MDSSMIKASNISHQTDKILKIYCHHVDVHYGKKQALFGVNLNVFDRQVTALIGPSGCGKSTFLRCLNRMNDTIDTCFVRGEIIIDGQDIYDPAIDPVELRAKVGIVFQKPNPFPKSIFENVAYGPRIHSLANNKADMEQIVITSLMKAGLFEEVKDRLHEPGNGIVGGATAALVYCACDCG